MHPSHRAYLGLLCALIVCGCALELQPDPEVAFGQRTPEELARRFAPDADEEEIRELADVLRYEPRRGLLSRLGDGTLLWRKSQRVGADGTPLGNLRVAEQPTILESSDGVWTVQWAWPTDFEQRRFEVWVGDEVVRTLEFAHSICHFFDGRDGRALVLYDPAPRFNELSCNGLWRTWDLHIGWADLRTGALHPIELERPRTTEGERHLNQLVDLVWLSDEHVVAVVRRHTTELYIGPLEGPLTHRPVPPAADTVVFADQNRGLSTITLPFPALESELFATFDGGWHWEPIGRVPHRWRPGGGAADHFHAESRLAECFERLCWIEKAWFEFPPGEP